jgi:hypothetical protein
VVPLLEGGLVVHTLAEPATETVDQRVFFGCEPPAGQSPAPASEWVCLKEGTQHDYRPAHRQVRRPDLGVFSSRLIMEEGVPILLVLHDDNGA